MNGPGSADILRAAYAREDEITGEHAQGILDSLAGVDEESLWAAGITDPDALRGILSQIKGARGYALALLKRSGRI